MASRRQNRLKAAPRKAPPSSIAYRKIILDLLRDTLAPDKFAQVLTAVVTPEPMLKFRADAPRDIDTAFGRVRLIFERTLTQRLERVRDAFGRVISSTRRGANEQTKALIGIEPFGAVEPRLRDTLDLVVAENVDLIRSIGEQHFAQVRRIVTQGAQRGTPAKQLGAEISERFNVSLNRGRLIARDQMAKFATNMMRVRMQSIGLDRYRWSTSRDERVRDTHRANDGKIFSWDDPPAETGHPGDDVNCRCVAVPVFAG